MGPLSPSDTTLIERARDLIANSVMSELTKEDSQSQTEFQNSVRHHIVAFSQHIHVCLLVLDKLMDIYNSSFSIADKK